MDLIFSQEEAQTDNQKIVPLCRKYTVTSRDVNNRNCRSGESNDKTLKTNIPTELIIKEED